MTDDQRGRLRLLVRYLERLPHLDQSYVADLRALLAESAAPLGTQQSSPEEVAALGPAGWLAQIVVEKLGGTDDIPAWVHRSAQYWREATAAAPDSAVPLPTCPGPCGYALPCPVHEPDTRGWHPPG